MKAKVWKIIVKNIAMSRISIKGTKKIAMLQIPNIQKIAKLRKPIRIKKLKRTALKNKMQSSRKLSNLKPIKIS